jgi:basic membrane protein A
MKKRILILIILCCMVMMSVACANSTGTAQEVEGESNEEVVQEEIVQEEEEMPSVGLILTGPINDMDWNATGYDGIMRIADTYGADVSFAESVAQSDFEEVFRNYAEGGYDIIFGHSGMFRDSILVVAESYPDTQFVCINGTDVRDNLSNVESAEAEAGFLMGATAALMTETNTVGIICPVDIKPVRENLEGFVLGAKYINPDIEALTAMTGDWVDAAKAKEIAVSMHEGGADIVANGAGIAGISIIDAASASGNLVIGMSQTQHEAGPDTVPVCVIRDNATFFPFIYENYLNGELEQTVYNLGIEEGAVYMEYYGDISDDIKDQIKEISEAIVRGEIQVKMEE